MYCVSYLEELEQDEELEKEHDELDEQLELHEDDADEEQEEDSGLNLCIETIDQVLTINI